MSLFILRTTGTAGADMRINEIRYKLLDNNVLKNPFVAKIIKYKNLKYMLNYYVVDIKPIYFNASIFGWLYLIPLFYFFGFTWWLIPGIILASFGVFWTATFYYLMFKISIKKTCKDVKVSRIKAKNFLELLLKDEIVKL